MIKKVIVCDKCDKQVEEGKAFKLSLFKERKMDGSGECENWYWVADICPNCLVSITTRLLKIVDVWNFDQKKTLLGEMNLIRTRTE